MSDTFINRKQHKQIDEALLECQPHFLTHNDGNTHTNLKRLRFCLVIQKIQGLQKHSTAPHLLIPPPPSFTDSSAPSSLSSRFKHTAMQAELQRLTSSRFFLAPLHPSPHVTWSCVGLLGAGHNV